MEEAFLFEVTYDKGMGYLVSTWTNIVADAQEFRKEKDFDFGSIFTINMLTAVSEVKGY